MLRGGPLENLLRWSVSSREVKTEMFIHFSDLENVAFVVPRLNSKQNLTERDKSIGVRSRLVRVPC